MKIIEHKVEKLVDPTGILTGERYEFILSIEVPEDDELYSEKGIYVRVIYVHDETETRIAQYSIHENETNAYIDFELEDDELELIFNYCKEKLQ
ncbi:DUF6509 family protein [Calidifontibacillus oryziterrae]|uniref:DUF6509 family protein n=1 Tax=Calidifontibacillus oryziterrae TaxID=1191699 RepID=UPI00031C89CA|nr:DUF6509 family protein [Calidifontibacillus oryziterrae]